MNTPPLQPADTSPWEHDEPRAANQESPPPKPHVGFSEVLRRVRDEAREDDAELTMWARAAVLLRA